MIYPKVKIWLDTFFSILLLSILSPLFLLIALAIKLDSKGPVFFLQHRLGQQGKSFTFIKFRSMCQNAEKGGVYEKKGDKRVTRVGRLLRKTSLDELPQLINILRGEMSLIGPRPVLTYHPWPLNDYSTEQKKRFNVKPGITGWAQINGRKNLDWRKRIQYDIDYVAKLSFAMDVDILFQTIYKVCTMQDNINIQPTALKGSF